MKHQTVSLKFCAGKKIGSLNNKNAKKHGLHKSPTYLSWDAMIARCTRPSHIAYNRYGGAGITICKEWMLFENFVKDMGIRPDNLTLERINNAKGYSKENCKWATRIEQQANRKTTPRITYMGNTYTLSEWAIKLNIKRDTIYKRMKRNWPIERILQT